MCDKIKNGDLKEFDLEKIYHRDLKGFDLEKIYHRDFNTEPMTDAEFDYWSGKWARSENIDNIFELAIKAGLIKIHE